MVDQFVHWAKDSQLQPIVVSSSLKADLQLFKSRVNNVREHQVGLLDEQEAQNYVAQRLCNSNYNLSTADLAKTIVEQFGLLLDNVACDGGPAGCRR